MVHAGPARNRWQQRRNSGFVYRPGWLPEKIIQQLGLGTCSTKSSTWKTSASTPVRAPGQSECSRKQHDRSARSSFAPRCGFAIERHWKGQKKTSTTPSRIEGGDGPPRLRLWLQTWGGRGSSLGSRGFKACRAPGNFGVLPMHGGLMAASQLGSKQKRLWMQLELQLQQQVNQEVLSPSSWQSLGGK